MNLQADMLTYSPLTLWVLYYNLNFLFTPRPSDTLCSAVKEAKQQGQKLSIQSHDYSPPKIQLIATFLQLREANRVQKLVLLAPQS